MAHVHFDIDNSADNLNLALGITDERREELIEPFKKIVLTEVSGDSNEVSILNILEGIRDLAQTPGELVFMVFNLDGAVQQVINPIYNTLMNRTSSSDGEE